MNTTLEKQPNNQSGTKRQAPKASTNELPMVDLETVLDFVKKIENDGLQTLSQHEVSRRMKYAAHTSTPFYRRMAAARLFGLLDTRQGVTLTTLALDYFKPTDEEGKTAALLTAVKNVVGYQRILERYAGRRIPPVDILKHSIERDFMLTNDAAKACADVFLKSAQQARIIKSDGTLSSNAQFRQERAPESTGKSEVQTAPTSLPAVLPPTTNDSETHYLSLDAKRGRRVVVQAPPVITEGELHRLQNWLAVQLHVVKSLEFDEAPTDVVEDG